MLLRVYHVLGLKNSQNRLASNAICVDTVHIQFPLVKLEDPHAPLVQKERQDEGEGGTGVCVGGHGGVGHANG